MAATEDTLHAFIPGPRIHRPALGQGRLSGLTFAVKDLFEVEGSATTAGNPEWGESHGLATVTASVVQDLLDDGAELIGKTILDELAYSLSGINPHYGAPINPAVPGRTTGGSSSGSAAATAGSLCTFALGTDTGGSVRVPASYCGIFGIRTTHGAVSTHGVVPLAPSFDAVGWFARDARTLRVIGKSLLKNDGAHWWPSQVVVATDTFALVDDPGYRDALEATVRSVVSTVGAREEATIYDLDGSYAACAGDWRECFRVLQAREAWQTHGQWIEARHPYLGSDVQDRFDLAKTTSETDEVSARRVRGEIVRAMDELLRGDRVLLLPTAPGIAPARNADGQTLAAHRASVLSLAVPASLAGVPQVSIPASRHEDGPLGLSIMGPRGSDAVLLEWVESLTESLSTDVLE